MSDSPDEIYYFCQAIRMIYAICDDDDVARDRVFEMIDAVEGDPKLTPLDWIENNSPLDGRELH